MPSLKGLVVRLRKEGILHTWRAFVAALVPYHFGVYELVQATKPGTPPPFPIVQGLEGLRTLRSRRTDLPADYFRDEAGAAEVCFAATVEEGLAGVLWILDTTHPSRFIDLAPDSVELAYVHVHPEFRGRGIAKAMILEASHRMRCRGYDRVFAVIDERNLSSQRAFGAVGFRHIAALRRPALFGPRYIASEARVEIWRNALVRLTRGRSQCRA